MRFILYSCFFVCIVGCSSTKELEVDRSEEVVEVAETSNEPTIDTVEWLEGKNVKITMSTYLPYCGGAQPTEEMLNRSEPYAETVNLINLSDGSKIKCTPNAEGVLYLELPNGNYAIQEVYKDVSFEKFMRENALLPDSRDQAIEPCYIRWWKSYLITFEVSNEQPTVEVNAMRPNKCFTGFDPCTSYEGVMPP